MNASPPLITPTFAAPAPVLAQNNTLFWVLGGLGALALVLLIVKSGSDDEEHEGDDEDEIYDVFDENEADDGEGEDELDEDEVPEQQSPEVA